MCKTAEFDPYLINCICRRIIGRHDTFRELQSEFEALKQVDDIKSFRLEVARNLRRRRNGQPVDP